MKLALHVKCRIENSHIFKKKTFLSKVTIKGFLPEAHFTMYFSRFFFYKDTLYFINKYNDASEKCIVTSLKFGHIGWFFKINQCVNEQVYRRYLFQRFNKVRIEITTLNTYNIFKSAVKRLFVTINL